MKKVIQFSLLFCCNLFILIIHKNEQMYSHYSHIIEKMEIKEVDKGKTEYFFFNNRKHLWNNWETRLLNKSISNKSRIRKEKKNL